MNKKNESGLYLSPGRNTRQSGRLLPLAGCCIFWGWLLLLLSITGVKEPQLWWHGAAVGSAVCGLSILLWKRRSVLYPVLLGAALVLALLGRKQLLDGFNLYWTSAGQLWTAIRGKLILTQTGSGTDNAVVFCITLCILLSVVSCRMVQRCPRASAGVLAVCAAAASIALERAVWPVLALAALVLAMVSWDGGVMLMRGALCLLCGLFLALVCYGITPIRNGTLFTQLSLQVQQQVHILRYERGDETKLPEGDFTAPVKESASTQTALLVTMTQPEELYLRGFVGDRFSEDGWETISNQTAAENSALLYWLHRDTFWPQQQLQRVLDGEENQVSVKNVAACRNYLYLPYNLRTLSGSNALSVENLQPSAVMAEGLRGEDGYSFTTVMVDQKRLNETIAQLQMTRETDYRTQESGYREFILEQDLQLPEQGMASLEAALEACAAVYGGSENLTLEQTQACVSLFLQKYLAEGELTLPLAETAEQTAYQAATATVLALRYYGIPARYVEGYHISQTLAQSAEPGETISVPASCGTAWAEVYQDGVGWIPLPLTPGFQEISQQITDTLESMENGGLTQGDGEYVLPEGKELEQEQQEQEEQEQAPADRTPQVQLEQKARLWWLLALIPLALLAGLWLRRRWILKKRLALFAQEDHRQALCCLFADSARLLEKLGLRRNGGSMLTLAGTERLPQTLAEQLYRTAQDNNEAMFSSHPICEEQRQAAAQLRLALIAQLKQQSRWYRKLALQWLQCLY